MFKKRITITAIVICVILFSVFVLFYEKRAYNKAKMQIEEHAMIIADDLWNYNYQGASEYLALAAVSQSYETFVITANSGQVFATVSMSHIGKFKQFLIQMRLMPRVKIMAHVTYKGNMIGWIEAIWISDTFFLHTYIFFVLIMIISIVYLYLSLLEEKHRLEERVNERTTELTKTNESLKQEIFERLKAWSEKKELEQELIRSKKMESLGLLAGGVAHDLNNVLSGIVSYPDLILMDLPKTSPLRRPILTIQKSGQKAASIVQDLLTLARRGVITNEPVNFNDLLSEHLDSPEHKKLLSFHPNIIIEKKIEPGLPNIKGSAIHLKTTIMNLLSNAVEAQPQGGTIKILTASRYLDKPVKGYDTVEEGDYVVFTIEDQGEGISKSDLYRIFEPFYTKKVMGRSGTGLGMAVVWGTVQDHSGYIDIQSHVGRGTTFDLFFPMTREHVIEAIEGVSVNDLKGNNETILVVDDIEEQREVVLKILSALNYSVQTVASGEEALDFLKNEKVDLVILDMIMDPGIDGLETYRRILRIHPNQKAIITSGFAETERVREALALGVGEYIKKPYMIEKIGVAVKKELGRA